MLLLVDRLAPHRGFKPRAAQRDLEASEYHVAHRHLVNDSVEPFDQELLDVGDAAGVLIFRQKDDAADSAEIAAAVNAALPGTGVAGRAYSWEETGGPFIGGMLVTKFVGGILHLVLAIIAAAGVLNTALMSVFERTREIGVLRAVGAANPAVRKVVVVEGIMVGLMSWVFSTVLSAPVGRVLAGAVIQSVLKAQTNFQYSVVGVIIWLAIVIGIGIISSLGPAQNAVRLSVREVLDYE